MNLHEVRKYLQRFLAPAAVVSLYYFFKFKAKISPKAEVELSSNIDFGPGCVVGSFTKIKATDGRLSMGPRGGLATGCFIAASTGGIRIGDNFICGPNVNIIGSNYIYSEAGVHMEDVGSTSKGIRVGNNVWVGAGTTILDGSVIGDNTIVVANSLVNRRFPANCILQGNPAKILMHRNMETTEKKVPLHA